MPSKLVLAALSALCLAAPPALAAPTAKEKFEKKIARYAQPAGAPDFTKPRGLCSCGPNDPTALVGQTGVLVYDYQSAVGVEVPRVLCVIPAFDVTTGDLAATQNCQNWTLLSR